MLTELSSQLCVLNFQVLYTKGLSVGFKRQYFCLFKKKKSVFILSVFSRIIIDSGVTIVTRGVP